VCERTERGWALTEPVSDLADGDVVAAVIEAMRGHMLAPEDFVTGEGAYGLDAPRARLDVFTEAGPETVVIGRPAAEDATRVYAARTDEPTVARIPVALARRLASEAENLRLRTPARLEYEEAARIEVSREFPEFEIERRDGNWEIVGPPKAVADGPAVRQLLAGLNACEVKRFVDEPAEQGAYGLEGGWRVKVAGREGAALADLTLGGADGQGGWWARRGGSGSVFALPDTAWIRDVRQGRAGFVSREVASVDPAKVTRVSVRGSEGEQVVEKRGGTWALTGPVKGAADADAVAALLETVSPLRAKRWVPFGAGGVREGDYGLDKPAWEIAVAGDGVGLTLRVGAEVKGEPGARYARLAGGERVFVPGDDTVVKLTAGLASKRVCRLVEGELESLKFVRGGREVTYERTDGVWVNGQGRPAGAALRAALDVLRDFGARRVAAFVISDRAGAGLVEPLLVVEIRQARLETVKRVTVGAAVKEGGVVRGYYVTGPDSGWLLEAQAGDVAKLLAAAERGD
jgi:hypothetical protein